MAAGDRSPQSGCERLCLDFPANPKSELFGAILPFPMSVEKQQWSSSRSLSSLQKAILPHLKKRQSLGPGR